MTRSHVGPQLRNLAPSPELKPMTRKCDRCNRPATNHSVEIVKGEKIQKHLCDLHAKEEGLTSQQVGHTSLPDLLTGFVAKAQQATDSESSRIDRDLACDQCGTTFRRFEEQSLLGCPHCYITFESMLGNLLERAHEGASHHVGKVPRRAGSGEQRQAQLMRMRQRLEEAVSSEDYELAARLRDDIRVMEEPV